MICFSEECKNARPRAAPIATLSSMLHESGWKAEPPTAMHQSRNMNNGCNSTNRQIQLRLAKSLYLCTMRNWPHVGKNSCKFDYNKVIKKKKKKSALYRYIDGLELTHDLQLTWLSVRLEDWGLNVWLEFTRGRKFTAPMACVFALTCTGQ